MKIYRFRFSRNRFGACWHGEPEFGLDKLLFPVIVGVTYLPDGIALANRYIARARDREAMAKQRRRKVRMPWLTD